MKGSDIPGNRAIYGKTVYDVAAAAVSPDHVITLTPDQPFDRLGAINSARRLVPRPSAFLPEKPDLPGAGADLLVAIPNEDGKKYWEYACVLDRAVQGRRDRQSQPAHEKEGARRRRRGSSRSP